MVKIYLKEYCGMIIYIYCITEIFITVKIVQESIRNRMNLKKSDEFIVVLTLFHQVL